MQLKRVLAVEIAAGLVGKHHHRLVHQGSGHSHTLAFAATEGGGFVQGPVGQVQVFQQLRRPPSGVVRLVASDESRYHHILDSGEFGQQVVGLENEPYLLVSEACQESAAA